MLLPFATDEEKDVMVSSIGPFWDANETWLVLGIGVLLIAFPLAHGIVLSALYLPVAVMLIGLILRGVSFDFRVKARAARKAHVEPAVLARLADRGGGPGLDAGQLPHRLRPRPALIAVQPGHRADAADGLRHAGRRLADHEDRRRAAGQGRCAGPAPSCGRWAWR